MNKSETGRCGEGATQSDEGAVVVQLDLRDEALPEEAGREGGVVHDDLGRLPGIDDDLRRARRAGHWSDRPA